MKVKLFGEKTTAADDNATIHTAQNVNTNKEENGTNSLLCTEWPAQSPDLNIINYIWLHIKRKLEKAKATSLLVKRT